MNLNKTQQVVSSILMEKYELETGKLYELLYLFKEKKFDFRN